MSTNFRFPTGLTVFVVAFGFAFSLQDRVNNSCCIWLDLWGFTVLFLKSRPVFHLFVFYNTFFFKHSGKLSY